MKRTHILAVVVVLVAITGGALALTGGVAVDGTISIDAGDDGPLVHFVSDGTTDLDLDAPVPDDHTVDITADGGAVDFTSEGSTEVTVAEADITSDELTVSDLDASSAGLTIDTDFGEQYTVSGQAQQFEIYQLGYDDDTADFRYVSSAGVDVTVTLPTDTRVMAVDADTGEPLDGADTDANGEATFSLEAGDRRVAIQHAPGVLEIRNELNNTRIEDANVTVEFYFERTNEPDTIIGREADNGIVDMVGLPTGEPFVAEVIADGYYSRRIFVPSLFETQQIYVLPDNETAVDTEFVLEDYSGAFPSDTSVLEVQRNINESWQTVEGDFFGAGGRFQAILDQDRRHRLVVTNVQTGETRTIGTYTPVVSAQVPLEVFDDDEEIVDDDLPTIRFDPETRTLPAGPGVEITADVAPGDQTFSSYTGNVTVDGSVVTSFNGNNPAGETFTESVDLSGHAGETATVSVSYELDDGTSGTAGAEYGVRPFYDNENSLFNVLDRLRGGDGPGGFSMFMGMIAVALTVAKVGRTASPDVTALAGLGVLVVLVVIGWVPRTWLFLGGVWVLATMGLQRI